LIYYVRVEQTDGSAPPVLILANDPPLCILVLRTVAIITRLLLDAVPANAVIVVAIRAQAKVRVTVVLGVAFVALCPSTGAARGGTAARGAIATAAARPGLLLVRIFLLRLIRANKLLQAPR
jgi:hypothetical protein